MEWKLEELKRDERKRGKNAMVRYAKIWLGKWWKWDEEREKLWNERGTERESREKERREGKKKGVVE